MRIFWEMKNLYIWLWRQQFGIFLKPHNNGTTRLFKQRTLELQAATQHSVYLLPVPQTILSCLLLLLTPSSQVICFMRALLPPSIRLKVVCTNCRTHHCECGTERRTTPHGYVNWEHSGWISLLIVTAKVARLWEGLGTNCHAICIIGRKHSIICNLRG